MSYFDNKALLNGRDQFLNFLNWYKNDTPQFNNARKRVLDLFDTYSKVLEKLIEHKKLMGILNTEADPDQDNFYFNYFTPICIEDLEIELKELKTILQELTTKNAEWEEKVKDNNLN